MKVRDFILEFLKGSDTNINILPSGVADFGRVDDLENYKLMSLNAYSNNLDMDRSLINCKNNLEKGKNVQFYKLKEKYEYNVETLLDSEVDRISVCVDGVGSLNIHIKGIELIKKCY